MKRLYCLIVLLFVYFGALAQGDATTKNDIAKKLKGVSFEQLKKDLSKGNPLFFINGDELKDSLSNEGFKGLRSEDVLSIDVLKPVDAIKIYGEKGKNGAVLISTNAGLPGPDPDAPLPPPVVQTRDTIYKDTSKFDDKAQFVIDGELSNSKLNGVNPDEILDITVLKPDKIARYFESNNRYETVLVTTKKYAIKKYQTKLAGFSKAYKDYLQAHGNNDTGILYMLDSKQLAGEPAEIIKILYEVPVKKIKKVSFLNDIKFANLPNSVLAIRTKNEK